MFQFPKFFFFQKMYYLPNFALVCQLLYIYIYIYIYFPYASCLRKKPLLSLTKSRILPKAKEILKSTRDGSAGNDLKGYLIFQETSLPGNESSPLLVYFVQNFLFLGMFPHFIKTHAVPDVGIQCFSFRPRLV